MSNRQGIHGSEGTPRREDQVGRLLRGGEYQIKSVVGHGGMGKVFLVSHIALDMPLALKQCRADSPLPESVSSELDQLLNSTQPGESDPDRHHSGDADQSLAQRGAVTDFPSSGGTHTDRFLREALLLARLHHPSIPALYDYFFEDGYWYLVMDYVPGQTLSTYMRKQGMLSPFEALNYAMQLCDVLEYLHQQTPSVVFRDLKPANIILTPDCRLVLVDFNIARYFKEGQLNDTTDLGSPGYAPPEQYQGGGQTDARSDLYSLGVILHEMLSGKRPASIGKQLEPLHSINPVLSLALSGLVSVATRLEPEYRFQSAYTFFCALERAYTMEEQHAYQEAALTTSQKQPGQSQPKRAHVGHPHTGRPHAGPPHGEHPHAGPPPHRTPARGVPTIHGPLAMRASRRGGDVYSRDTPCGYPGGGVAGYPGGGDGGGGYPGDGIGGDYSGAERQHIREILLETHRERQEDDHLEEELTSVDESLHLRAYMSFSSALLPSTSEQEPRGERGKPSLFAAPSLVQRVIHICFVCALILFLVMASLLALTRVTRQDNTITPELQTSATPGATPVPTPDDSWQQLPSPSSPEADNTATYVRVQGKAYIYMNGGYRGPKNTPHYDRGLYRYDITNAHWEMLTNTDAPDMVNNAAALDERGYLFFTVGYSPDVYAVSSLLYEYQPPHGTFQKIVPPDQIPIGFGGSMIADQQGHLYITQGFLQAGNPQTTAGTGWYRYDIATGQWHQLASLPLGLGYVVLVSDGEGNILLLGGAVDAGQHQPTKNIYRYDIALNSWTLASTTAPFAFSGAASCLNGSGHLIVIGGYNTAHNTSLNTVWQVDLHTLHWTPLPPLPNGGSLLGAAACDGHGHVFLVRGANNPAQPTANFLELTIRS